MTIHKIKSPLSIPQIYKEEFGGFDSSYEYTYKCPNCGGEFNTPSIKENKVVCPFCGKEMKGLEVNESY